MTAGARSQHDDPHFHPKSGACDCLCNACDDGEDVCRCPDCNRRCGHQHSTAGASGQTARSSDSEATS